jgi:hypothetical protein
MSNEEAKKHSTYREGQMAARVGLGATDNPYNDDNAWPWTFGWQDEIASITRANQDAIRRLETKMQNYKQTVD